MKPHANCRVCGIRLPSQNHRGYRGIGTGEWGRSVTIQVLRSYLHQNHHRLLRTYSDNTGCADLQYHDNVRVEKAIRMQKPIIIINTITQPMISHLVEALVAYTAGRPSQVSSSHKHSVHLPGFTAGFDNCTTKSHVDRGQSNGCATVILVP